MWCGKHRRRSAQRKRITSETAEKADESPAGAKGVAEPSPKVRVLKKKKSRSTPTKVSKKAVTKKAVSKKARMTVEEIHKMLTTKGLNLNRDCSNFDKKKGKVTMEGSVKCGAKFYKNPYVIFLYKKPNCVASGTL